MAARDLVQGVILEVGLDSQLGTMRAESAAMFAPARGRGLLAQANDWFMRNVVKPAPWIRTPAGVARYAPYGEPDTSLAPLFAAGVLAAGVAGAAGFVGFGMWVAKRAARRQNPRRRRR